MKQLARSQPIAPGGGRRNCEEYLVGTWFIGWVGNEEAIPIAK